MKRNRFSQRFHTKLVFKNIHISCDIVAFAFASTKSRFVFKYQVTNTEKGKKICALNSQMTRAAGTASNWLKVSRRRFTKTMNLVIRKIKNVVEISSIQSVQTSLTLSSVDDYQRLPLGSLRHCFSSDTSDFRCRTEQKQALVDTSGIDYFGPNPPTTSTGRVALTNAETQGKNALYVHLWSSYRI